MTTTNIQPGQVGLPGVASADGQPTPRAGLRTRVLRGAGWTVANRVSTNLLQLASSLILTRLLVPEIFGVMLIVNLFIQGLQLFSDIGIGPSIVQNKRGDDAGFLNTAWTIQVIRGIGLWLASTVIAYPVALAYEEPQLMWLIPVAGLTAFIAGFNSTKLFTLQRHVVGYGIGTVLNVGGRILSIVVMVGWALAWPSAWALVAGGLTYNVVKMAGSHLLIEGPNNRLHWDRECGGSLFRFGRWVFLSTVVAFLASHMDRAGLGLLLTKSELGLYSLALSLALFIPPVADTLASATLFPALSRLQEKPQAMMAACLKARRYILMAAGAAAVGTVIGAPLFFELAYTAEWHGAGAMAQWIAVYAWVRVLGTGVENVPLAVGKPRVLFWANLIRSVGLVLGIYGFELAGITGFIIGMTIAAVMAHIFVLCMLPERRVACLMQSLASSLILGGYAVVCLMAADLLGWTGAIEGQVVIVLTCAFACIPPSIAVWNLIRSNRAAASCDPSTDTPAS